MSNTPADRLQCRALRAKTGEPCRGRAIADGLCWAHQPQAQQWRAKGGHERSNAARSVKALPERLRPVADVLSTAMTRTFRGDMDPRVATALASLAGAYVRVVTAGDFEARLAALEAATPAGRGGVA